ncbi:hypothetical protein [uncultured Vibrio sp.]|uniref:hypothetical protein n=1 Tax=uncultured Vibrio sp. TaxID=114054 RepID=UPI002638F571|nr:hypothetical protein [uncultured Vibrio sp.]
MNDTLKVLTARGKREIIDTGGSQAWALNPVNAKAMTYLVCVQNRNASWGTGEAEHHHAFLVAKIKEIVKSFEREDRWLVMIDAFAEVDIPNQWNGDRNPVSYCRIEDLGVDVDSLRFEYMPNKPWIEIIIGNEFYGSRLATIKSSDPKFPDVHLPIKCKKGSSKESIEFEVKKSCSEFLSTFYQVKFADDLT